MTVTHTFRVEGMRCGGCGLLVDDAVEDLPGVRTSTTSVRAGRTVVEAGAEVDPGRIAAAITAAGYPATRVA
ncbi:hypothetical protein Lfu02_42800 [Longispora fulva]|uniref:Copper chaperone CopZ n=1 Tax=Longispora fulva TaxID=619741 RepID=A0A8J7GRB2_9ACTN|nr:cation transporter [Longispora fulva]MBG6136738.1 copper chaperone CopZ [Longispora fulva]GIG59908.1 hypothetical protein Lfu02_42800 [Longispora fulva]